MGGLLSTFKNKRTEFAPCQIDESLLKDFIREDKLNLVWIYSCEIPELPYIRHHWVVCETKGYYITFTKGPKQIDSCIHKSEPKAVKFGSCEGVTKYDELKQKQLRNTTGGELFAFVEEQKPVYNVFSKNCQDFAAAVYDFVQ